MLLTLYPQLGVEIYVAIVTATCTKQIIFVFSKVPWTDLRYLFGDIMYGGHITDDWDRRLCRTYLAEYMKPELASQA